MGIGDYTDPDAIVSQSVDPAAALASMREASTPTAAPRRSSAGRTTDPALVAQIRGQRRTALSWTWPIVVAESLNEIGDDDERERVKRHLRFIRESARDNTIEGLDLAAQAYRAGNLEAARQYADRASARWNRWIRQAAAIEAAAEAESQSWWDAVAEAIDEIDPLAAANALEDAVDTAVDTGRSMMAIVGIAAIVVLGVSLTRR
jgi:hypothetical protein